MYARCLLRAREYVSLEFYLDQERNKSAILILFTPIYEETRYCIIIHKNIIYYF